MLAATILLLLLLTTTYFKNTILSQTLTIVTIANTGATVSTVTTSTNVTTVNTGTTLIVKYQILLLYSIIGNFFTKSYHRPTNRQTTRLLELLRVAKNLMVSMSNSTLN